MVGDFISESLGLKIGSESEAMTHPARRLRRSSEYGFAIHAGLLPADSLNHIRLAMGIPRFSLLGKRSRLKARSREKCGTRQGNGKLALSLM